MSSATLIGTAPEFDLAVIKVDDPVPAITKWGNSSELLLGSGVIAIGSALGQYKNSVTAGILSGFNRQLGGLNGLLQTDAAINHCNSGGPLINMGGQMIGIQWSCEAVFQTPRGWALLFPVILLKMLSVT